MQEQTLFNANDIMVTTTRLQVGKTLYPIAGITSVEVVKNSKKVPNSLGQIGVLLALCLACVGGASLKSAVAVIVGLLAAIALAVLFRPKTKFTFAVRVATAGGQKDAVTSEDEATVNAVVAALNQAIIQRG